MGKPATTYFCEKGHQCGHSPANMYGELDCLLEDEQMCSLLGEELPTWPQCKVCGSDIIRRPASEWQNNDNCRSQVIRVGSDTTATIIGGEIMRQPVGVFDVSSLMAEF